MTLHFTQEEFAERRRRALAAMAARRLDGLLLFKQESMHWLTGYDTFGYCFFQCLVLQADGDLVLLTRAPDLRQAAHTSIIEDVRVWVDREESNPAAELRDLLADAGRDRFSVLWAFGSTHRPWTCGRSNGPTRRIDRGRLRMLW